MAQAINVPKNVQSLHCFYWMDYLLKLVGDGMPIKNDIHFEPRYITEFHKDYADFCKDILLLLLTTSDR